MLMSMSMLLQVLSMLVLLLLLLQIPMLVFCHFCNLTSEERARSGMIGKTRRCKTRMSRDVEKVSLRLTVSGLSRSLKRGSAIAIKNRFELKWTLQQKQKWLFFRWKDDSLFFSHTGVNAIR